HLILHEADASLPDEELEATIKAVEAVMEEIEALSIPRLMVLNKIDLIDADQEAFLRRTYPEAVFVSARTGQGLNELQVRVKGFFDALLVRVELFFPYGDGRAIGEIYKVGADVDLENTPEGVIVRARLPQEYAGRFARFRR
ncbi:MAG: GTPase HflX, partial [Actinobacteria bacterium]|nr:GTPase HflX [Actinomycetota bacterium]